MDYEVLTTKRDESSLSIAAALVLLALGLVTVLCTPALVVAVYRAAF